MPTPPIDSSASSATSDQSIKRCKLQCYLNKHFHKPDLEALDVALAAYRAHYFDGCKPIWLWIVGTSGSGKTEIAIRSLDSLPYIKPVGELTAAALISAKKGQSGLLYRLPKRINGDKNYTGILTFKDFTSFLSMRREDRAVVIAQLREVADGRWSKDTGERGSQVWAGKVTVVAACTPALEMAWSVHRSMGDRFLTIRWRDGDDEMTANKAQEHDGLEEEMSRIIQQLASDYMGAPLFSPPPPLESFFIEPITKLALLSCWLRTPVHRDEYTHKIDDVGPKEKPTRMVKALRTLMCGHSALQNRPLITTDLKLAYRIAMDSVPLKRFKIVDSMPDDTELSFGDILLSSGLARTSLQRELDDLHEIGVLTLSTRKIEDNEKTFATLNPNFAQARAHILGLFSET